MNLWILKPGHKVRVAEGSEAEVLSGTEDGSWIKVRYLDTDDPLTAGTEDLVHEDEVEILLGVVERAWWGEEVVVLLHRVPESEDYEGGYEAVTLSGVPHDVSVTGSNLESGKGALQHLIAGLRSFGFSARIIVEDATYIGGVQRYEVDV